MTIIAADPPRYTLEDVLCVSKCMEGFVPGTNPMD